MNAINTSKIAVPFLAEFESNLPILMNGTVQYNSNFVGGNGTSLEVLVPDYGETVIGPDVTSSIGAYANGVKTVELVQYSKAIALTTVNKHLELSSYKDQVAEPYGAEMASTVQRIAANEILGNADTAVIVDQAAGGTYQDIGDTIALLNKARATGQKFGAVSPILASSIQNSGLTFFQADLKEEFFSGKLGKFRGHKWYETADIDDLVTKARVNTGANAVVTSMTEGSSLLTIKCATSGTGLVVPGEIVTVAGVDALDIYGKSLGKEYAFVVAEPTDSSVDGGGDSSDWDKVDLAYKFAETTANQVVLKVKPVYASGVLANVSALPKAADVTTFATDASSTYYRGFAWSKAAFIHAAAKLQKLSNLVVKADGNGLGSYLIVQEGADVRTGQDICRWDTLKGFLLGRSNWCSAILAKKQ
ncbi:MAG: hypothetical protein D4S01_03830 [Dehalococcoidia bacterium]|nr:MAG: hypothetical protein D4S01_03830 [Dehalococcoidia bacterium]